MKKILYIGYRDPLHSSAGGYDWITTYPNSDTLWDKDVPLGFIPTHKRGKFLNLLVLDLIARKQSSIYDVIHYFYGDTLRMPFKHHGKCRYVATLHMDVTKKLRESKSFARVVKSLDAVVVLSSGQQRELERMGIKSIYIPHGFNEPIFIKKNMDVNPGKINIVVSGSNYRDVDIMYYIINFCSRNRNDIHFHLLGQPATVKEALKNQPNVTCYRHLIDDEYYSLIQTCDYNFLPLTFATANNALLESQFLGVRSILPQIDGISDYAAPSPFNIYYQSKVELEYVFGTLQKKKGNSQELIEFAQTFSWNNIYAKLKEFYNTL